MVAADAFRRDVKLIPHARFDGAAAVAKLKPQISLALAGIANLFFVNEEKSSDGLLGVEIGGKGRLHVADAVPERFPNSRHFLCFFFCLLTSGLSLTS